MANLRLMSNLFHILDAVRMVNWKKVREELKTLSFINLASTKQYLKSFHIRLK
jgi:hypothetical protein